jgi:hypothetical protein
MPLLALHLVYPGTAPPFAVAVVAVVIVAAVTAAAATAAAVPCPRRTLRSAGRTENAAGSEAEAEVEVDVIEDAAPLDQALDKVRPT